MILIIATMSIYIQSHVSVFFWASRSGVGPVGPVGPVGQTTWSSSTTAAMRQIHGLIGACWREQRRLRGWDRIQWLQFCSSHQPLFKWKIYQQFLVEIVNEPSISFPFLDIFSGFLGILPDSGGIVADFTGGPGGPVRSLQVRSTSTAGCRVPGRFWETETKRTAQIWPHIPS